MRRRRKSFRRSGNRSVFGRYGRSSRRRSRTRRTRGYVSNRGGIRL